MQQVSKGWGYRWLTRRFDTRGSRHCNIGRRRSGRPWRRLMWRLRSHIPSFRLWFWGSTRDRRLSRCRIQVPAVPVGTRGGRTWRAGRQYWGRLAWHSGIDQRRRLLANDGGSFSKWISWDISKESLHTGRWKSFIFWRSAASYNPVPKFSAVWAISLYSNLNYRRNY